MEQNNDVKYLVFDIETVADEDLIKEVKYPHDQITPREARKKFTDELIKKKDDDFIPYTFQFPVTLAMALVREDFTIVPDGMADEVPLVSYKDSEKARRVWKMNVRGRIQWYTWRSATGSRSRGG